MASATPRTGRDPAARLGVVSERSASWGLEMAGEGSAGSPCAGPASNCPFLQGPSACVGGKRTRCQHKDARAAQPQPVPRATMLPPRRACRPCSPRCQALTRLSLSWQRSPLHPCGPLCRPRPGWRAGRRAHLCRWWARPLPFSARCASSTILGVSRWPLVAHLAWTPASCVAIAAARRRHAHAAALAANDIAKASASNTRRRFREH